MKAHRDFVVLVKGTEEINALVEFSHSVHTPATQDVPAFDTEYLTVIYTNKLDSSAWPSKDKILQGLQVEMSVPPVGMGKFFGWKDVVGVDVVEPPVSTLTPDPMQKSSGKDGDVGDWTQTAGEGKTDDTRPATPAEASAAAVALVGPDGKTDSERGYVWGSEEHVATLRPLEPSGADPTLGTTEPAATEEPVPADPPADPIA